MYKHNILLIGLDTHKVFTEVAQTEDQHGATPFTMEKSKVLKQQ